MGWILFGVLVIWVISTDEQARRQAQAERDQILWEKLLEIEAGEPISYEPFDFEYAERCTQRRTFVNNLREFVK